MADNIAKVVDPNTQAFLAETAALRRDAHDLLNQFTHMRMRWKIRGMLVNLAVVDRYARGEMPPSGDPAYDKRQRGWNPKIVRYVRQELAQYRRLLHSCGPDLESLERYGGDPPGGDRDRG